MDSQSTKPDNKIYRGVPSGDVDEDLRGADDNAMEAGMSSGSSSSKNKKKRKTTPKKSNKGGGGEETFVPIELFEPMEVSGPGESTTDEEQDSNDFWLCCLAQGLFGGLGPLLVYCCNGHRRDYPTRAACEGCCTGLFVGLFLMIFFKAMQS